MPRRPLTIAFTFGVIAAFDASPCLAQIAPTEAPAPITDATERPKLEWYGWQTLAVDGAATGLFLSATADRGSTVLYGLSGVTYAIGAPSIHLGHGQWEMSIASLGVRVVTPLLGAAVGSYYDNCQTASVTTGPRSACSSKWETTGIAIGGLIAAVVDGLVFAYQPARQTGASARHAVSAPFSAGPSATLMPKGVMLGWTAPL